MFSSPASGDSTAPSDLKQHEWDLPGAIPRKSALRDYGYIKGGQAFGSTPEALIDLVQSKAGVSLVWTPATPEPVSAEKVPFLLEALRQKESRDARNRILIGSVLLSIAVKLTLGLQHFGLEFRSLFFLIGGLLLLDGTWLKVRLRHYTQEDAAKDASAVRYKAWLKKQGHSGYVIALAACIIIVGLFQFGTPDSTSLTGLVKPAVWKGEVSLCSRSTNWVLVEVVVGPVS